MKTLIKDAHGKWIEGTPVAGEPVIYEYDSGYSHESSEYTPENTPTPIIINSVSGHIKKTSDNSFITCEESTDLVISGSLDIPARDFSMPIRRDDGRLFLFPVSVRYGKFEVVINLPTTGQFKFTDNECNIDLPPNTFTVKSLKIDCLRSVRKEIE